MVCRKIPAERGDLGCSWLRLEDYGALASREHFSSVGLGKDFAARLLKKNN